MESQYDAKPASPIYDHLFVFQSEKQALDKLPAFQIGGKWNGGYIFPDIEVVIARQPKLVLPGYRVLISQTEPRLDFWETMPELEAIGDRYEAENSSNFYVRHRPDKAVLFYLMEPVPSGSRYHEHGFGRLDIGHLSGHDDHWVERAKYEVEIEKLKKALRATLDLVNKLRATSNEINFVVIEDGLQLMLIMLESRQIIFTNVLETLMKETIGYIGNKAWETATDEGWKYVVTALVVHYLEFVLATKK